MLYLLILAVLGIQGHLWLQGPDFGHSRDISNKHRNEHRIQSLHMASHVLHVDIQHGQEYKMCGIACTCPQVPCTNGISMIGRAPCTHSQYLAVTITPNCSTVANPESGTGGSIQLVQYIELEPNCTRFDFPVYLAEGSMSPMDPPQYRS